MSGKNGRRLRQVYDLLLERYGPQNWWPADTRFEMIIGAILVQSTAWANAAKALAALRKANALHPITLSRLSEAEIGELVRSSGFYTVKARRVKAFVDHLMERHGGDLDAMLSQDAGDLRRELLAIHGIGQETADCILLYAAGKPAFVIDEYTRRIVGRLGVGPGARASYSDLQAIFEEALPPDPETVRRVPRPPRGPWQGRMPEETRMPPVRLGSGVRVRAKGGLGPVRRRDPRQCSVRPLLTGYMRGKALLAFAPTAMSPRASSPPMAITPTELTPPTAITPIAFTPPMATNPTALTGLMAMSPTAFKIATARAPMALNQAAAIIPITFWPTPTISTVKNRNFLASVMSPYLLPEG